MQQLTGLKGQALRVKMEIYRKKPLVWYQEVWGGDPRDLVWSDIEGYENHVWDGDKDPLYQAWQQLGYGNWVAVHSASSTGKTYIAAVIVFWFLACYEGSTVVIVAPTEDQMKKNIWKEIAKAFPRFQAIYPEAQLRDEPSIFMAKDSTGKYRKDWTCYALVAGRQAGQKESDAAKGIHGKDVLVILEEATGVLESIVTTIQNTLTASNNLLLALGNPKTQTDPLYHLCKQGNIVPIRISALDHPNVVLNYEVFPGATTRLSINEKERRLGADNSIFKAQTRGLFPKEGVHTLIKQDDFEAIFNLDVLEPKDKDTIKKYEAEGKPFVIKDYESFNALGADVAASEHGDKACLVWGERNVCTDIEVFQCPDEIALAYNFLYGSDYVAGTKYRDYGTFNIHDKDVYPENIAIDTGGVGHATGRILVQEGYDDFIPVIGGEDKDCLPITGDNEVKSAFVNIWAQIYHQLALDIKRKNFTIICRDNQLKNKILAQASVVNSVPTAQGKSAITPKPERKKALPGNESPDELDAIAMWNWARKKRLGEGGGGGVSV